MPADLLKNCVVLALWTKRLQRGCGNLFMGARGDAQFALVACVWWSRRARTERRATEAIIHVHVLVHVPAVPLLCDA